MIQTKDIIELTDTYGANNYHPLPIVISKAEGVWLYLDQTIVDKSYHMWYGLKM
ncbi:hypothetical protein ACT453_07730, partial [Bacillus sp. D-CC]